jgi:hypothetical protein
LFGFPEFYEKMNKLLASIQAETGEMGITELRVSQQLWERLLVTLSLDRRHNSNDNQHQLTIMLTSGKLIILPPREED